MWQMFVQLQQNLNITEWVKAKTEYPWHLKETFWIKLKSSIFFKEETKYVFFSQKQNLQTHEIIQDFFEKKGIKVHFRI